MSTMNFDPQAFLEMPVDTPFEKRPPLPARDYTGTIKELSARQWTSKDKTNADGSPKSGIAYDLQIEVSIPGDVKESLGLKMDTLTLRDSIMLDLNDQGGLDSTPGRNNGLRAYREALGMNKVGEVFRARDMVGRLLTVRLKHEEYQGNIQERVGGVAKV